MKAVESGIDDCTDDLLRVASSRAPRDEENLEKNGTSRLVVKPHKIVGEVSFQAMNRGTNYAEIMDKEDYNLGEKSKQKSIRAVRSKFTKKALPVGSGYLSGTAEVCKDGYTDYVNYKIYEVISRDGFKVFNKK